MNRVLVISPHPDDESIGCGGTIRDHIVRGDFVEVLFLTSGESGGHGTPPAETARIREAEARAALEILEVQAVEFWRLPDGKLRADSETILRFREKLGAAVPDLVYVPHLLESHADHKAAYRIVRAALSGVAAQQRLPVVRTYEIWTPLAYLRQIVDITEHLELKLSAIRAHSSQCAVLPFDEAFRGLARYRGEMHSWPGGPYAEVFGSMQIDSRKSH